MDLEKQFILLQGHILGLHQKEWNQFVLFVLVQAVLEVINGPLAAVVVVD